MSWQGANDVAMPPSSPTLGNLAGRPVTSSGKGAPDNTKPHADPRVPGVKE